MSSETGNFILDSVSYELRSSILSAGTPLDLPARASVFGAGSLPPHLYFLTTGLASVVVRMQQGASAEVGMVGREGIVGASSLLGRNTMVADGFMQVAGKGYRVPLESAQAIFDSNTEFRKVVLDYVQKQLIVGQQAAACNRLHDAEPRLARWLLTVSDKVQSDVLGLTQEFLAEMLGTQRSTVALVAGRLQSRGIIEYRHGVVRVANRLLLEDTACECYEVTRSSTMESFFRKREPLAQRDGFGL